MGFSTQRAWETMIYLTLDEILTIHSEMIDRYGGEHGILNEGMLSSILDRMQTEFFGYNPFNTIIKKATHLYHSIMIYHPFVDGHKRTGIFATIAFLIKNDYYFQQSSAEDEIEFAAKTAEGEYDFQRIEDHLKQNIIEINKPNLISMAMKDYRFTCPRCKNHNVRIEDSYCHDCGLLLSEFKLVYKFDGIVVKKIVELTEKDFKREPKWVPSKERKSSISKS